MIRKICLILLAGLFFFGCDKINDDIVDQEISDIAVGNVSAADSVVLASTSSDTSFITMINFNDSKSINDVWFKLFTNDGSVVINDFGQMTDDGSIENGDEIANDNNYSAKIFMNNTDPYGFYNVEYFIRNVNKIVQKVAVKRFLFDNGQFNIPPEILNINAPDSITIEDETVVFLIEAEVADSNGLTDISSVWFVTVRPDSTSSGTKNFLNDTGADGDITADDGIYSSNFIAPPNAVTSGNWNFNFQAIDRRQNMSNIFIHSINIKNL